LTLKRGFILLISLVALGLGSYWLIGPRSDNIVVEIQRRGVLRVGLDASFPPFESLNEQGQVIGLDADIAREIAADLGVAVEFVNIGFDGLYDALHARRVDLVISGLPIDPRLTKDVAYSVSYFNAGQALLVRRYPAGPAAEITGPADLAGRTVAVEWGSLADMEARQLGRSLTALEIIPQPTAREAWLALAAGQAEAAIVDNIAAHEALASGEALVLVSMLTDEWYAVAVDIRRRALLAQVNQTLVRLEETQALEALLARWFRAQ
jgi:ABC-type amino acid transport substrate-binding protein